MSRAEVAFVDLSVEDFPIRFDMWAPGYPLAGRPTWSLTVDSPGAIRLPGFGPGTWSRITWGDGRVQWSPPPNFFDELRGIDAWTDATGDEVLSDAELRMALKQLSPSGEFPEWELPSDGFGA